MKIIPTNEDIQDSKGYGSDDALSPVEIDLKVVTKLSSICPTRKLWHEVMPTGNYIRKEDGSLYPEWVMWLDLPAKERAEEIEITAEKLARKMGWIKVAKTLRMPGGWMLSEAFDQVGGYSPGYLGNPITPMSSPNKMHEWGWKVWHRAQQILRPYEWWPSRLALQAACISHAFGDVGKIALRVAAASLPVAFGGGLGCDAARGHNYPSSLKGLRDARQCLINARGLGGLRRRWAHDQNVIECIFKLARRGYSLKEAEEIVIDTMFSRSIIVDNDWFVLSRKIPVKLGITKQVCFKYECGFYHTSGSELNRPSGAWSVVKEEVYTSPDPLLSPYHTSRGPSQAIYAWKQQKAVAQRAIKNNKKLKTLIERPDGATTIVFYQTSRDAGNCHAGTVGWAERHGFKNCAPLLAIVASERPEAKRVVQHVINTY